MDESLIGKCSYSSGLSLTPEAKAPAEPTSRAVCGCDEIVSSLL